MEQSRQVFGYYGRVAAASKQIPVFYEDTSFLKAQHRQSLKHQSEQRINSVLLASSDKLQDLKERNEERTHHKKRIRVLESLIEKRFENFQICEKAAIAIQRAYKKYIDKRNFDSLHVENHQQIISSHLEEHDQFIYYINFDFGKMPQKAAVTIQRAYRRHLFAKKIARIEKTYHIILSERVFNLYAIIRKVCYKYLAQQRVNWKTYKARRSEILIKIREKLAMIRIKIFWETSGLTYKKMMRRIRKYKKSAFNDDESDHVDVDSDQEDSEEERQRLEKEAKIARKVHMGYISYNISRKKPKSFLPYLNKKEIVECEYELPEEYKRCANRLFNDKGEPVFSNSISMHKKKKKNKKHYLDSSPKYMDLTISSRYYKQEFVPKYSIKSERTKSVKRKESTIMFPTKSSNNKIIEKTHEEKQRSVWKPHLVYDQKYVPGLQNSNYEPKVLYKRHSCNIKRVPILTPVSLEAISEVEHPVSMNRVAPFSYDFQTALPELSQLVYKYSNTYRRLRYSSFVRNG